MATRKATRTVSSSGPVSVDGVAQVESPVEEKKAVRPRVPGLSRDKILMVATQMFAENGFSATSVRDIAHECGITLPSIYHFFGDKESLYRHCVETIFNGVAQQLRDSLLGGGSPKSRVRQFTVVLCDVMLNNHDFRRLLQRALLRRNQQGVEELTTHYFIAEFKLLAPAFQALDPSLDPAEHAFSLYALTFGLVQIKRIGELAGLDHRRFNTPIHLAENVLSTVLPSVNWTT